jgi:hypothetical protein
LPCRLDYVSTFSRWRAAKSTKRTRRARTTRCCTGKLARRWQRRPGARGKRGLTERAGEQQGRCRFFGLFRDTNHRSSVAYQDNNFKATGQPSQSCEERAVLPVSIRPGFAHAQTVYANVDGTHMVSRYDVAKGTREAESLVWRMWLTPPHRLRAGLRRRRSRRRRGRRLRRAAGEFPAGAPRP